MHLNDGGIRLCSRRLTSEEVEFFALCNCAIGTEYLKTCWILCLTLQWHVSATIQAGPGECELAPPRPVLAIIKAANEYAEL